MLYVFYGTDTPKIRARALDMAEKASARGVRIEMLDAGGYQTGALTTLVGSVSLFGEEELIVLDTLSDSTEAFADLLASLEGIAGAPQTVVVIEGALDAKTVKVFKEFANEMHESKQEGAERFNPFSMADALSKKDKKSLWLLLTQAKEVGLSAEEIIGTLFWQLKALSLAKVTKSAAEAGMKDFPYNKAKTAAKSFSDEALFELRDSLVKLYHEGHLGRDIDLALEKWVLTLPAK